MIQVLFITPAEVRERASLDSNIDDNKIINAIIFAQDLTIEPLLGTIMFDEIKQQVIDDTLESKYITLLDYHIRKTLISTVLHKITLFLIYRFNNTGVTKNALDKQEILSREEIKNLRNEVSEYIGVYAERLTAYLKANKETYPLFDDVEEGKIKAKTEKLSNTLYLGDY